MHAKQTQGDDDGGQEHQDKRQELLDKTNNLTRASNDEGDNLKFKLDINFQN